MNPISLFSTHLFGKGSAEHIRPATAADREPLRRFLFLLSARSAYLRFFTGRPPLTDKTLDRLLGVQPGGAGFVAMARGEVVGHALCAPVHPGLVEIAVVVADRWQGVGIGTRLAQAAVAHTAAHGTRMVTMTVLAENLRARELVRRLWPDATWTVVGREIEYVIGSAGATTGRVA